MACYIGHSSTSSGFDGVGSSSLGGNFPAIRARSLRLFLQAPFLSQSVSQGEVSRPPSDRGPVLQFASFTRFLLPKVHELLMCN